MQAAVSATLAPCILPGLPCSNGFPFGDGAATGAGRDGRGPGLVDAAPRQRRAHPRLRPAARQGVAEGEAGAERARGLGRREAGPRRRTGGRGRAPRGRRPLVVPRRRGEPRGPERPSSDREVPSADHGTRHQTPALQTLPTQ